MNFARRPHWIKRMLSRSGLQSPLLTFDDGPHPEHTPAVLDRLREFNITAAFFLIGQKVAASPHLVEQIIEEGHFVGNHTFSHRHLGWFDFTTAHQEIHECQKLLPEGTLFRPPLGKLTPGLRLAARRQGLTCMNWTLDSNDWRCRSAAEAKTCAREVLELIRPGDIVLFHDNHQWIEPILDVILPAIANSSVLV